MSSDIYLNGITYPSSRKVAFPGKDGKEVVFDLPEDADAGLNAYSERPVQNKVIHAAIEDIRQRQTSPYNFKGSCTEASLPASAEINDTWYLTDRKYRVTWTGSAWQQSSLEEEDYESALSALRQANARNLLADINVTAKTSNGVTYTPQSDGTVITSGTATAPSYYHYYSNQSTFPAGFEAGKRYYADAGGVRVRLVVFEYYAEPRPGKTSPYSLVYNSSGAGTFWLSADATGLIIRLDTDKGVSTNEKLLPIISPVPAQAALYGAMDKAVMSDVFRLDAEGRLDQVDALLFGEDIPIAPHGIPHLISDGAAFAARDVFDIIPEHWQGGYRLTFRARLPITLTYNVNLRVNWRQVEEAEKYIVDLSDKTLVTTFAADFTGTGTISGTYNTGATPEDVINATNLAYSGAKARWSHISSGKYHYVRFSGPRIEASESKPVYLATGAEIVMEVTVSRDVTDTLPAVVTGLEHDMDRVLEDLYDDEETAIAPEDVAIIMADDSYEHDDVRADFDFRRERSRNRYRMTVTAKREVTLTANVNFRFVWARQGHQEDYIIDLADKRLRSVLSTNMADLRPSALHVYGYRSDTFEGIISSPTLISHSFKNPVSIMGPDTGSYHYVLFSGLRMSITEGSEAAPVTFQAGDWISVTWEINAAAGARLPEVRTLAAAAFNPYARGYYIDHLFIDGINSAEAAAKTIIPSESLEHIRASSRLGFHVIEANVQRLSDGNHIVMHGDSGTFGFEVQHVDGATDISGVRFADVDLDWVKTNVRYVSRYERYRVAPPTLEEFCAECRCHNMIPFASCSLPETVAILDQYMGRANYIAYNGKREYTSAPITEFLRLTSKEKILQHCRGFGVPYYYCMANPTAFTDAELADIVHALHAEGYGITIATVYAGAHQDNRCMALGFDGGSAGCQVNPFESGNICNLTADVDFGEFETTGTVADGVLYLSNRQYIRSPNVYDPVFLGKGCLKVRFKGLMSIYYMDRYNQEIRSDGSHEVTLSTYFLEQAPYFAFTAHEDGCEVYSISFKASKV